MTTTANPARPDFTAIKGRQQATWASGDYHRVASLITSTADRLCDTADLRAGWRVLDVATGSGNAALAAARRGGSVVGVDYVPELLERGHMRAQAEGLGIEFIEGDAEDLPFADATFDATISVFGAMFAPNHRQTAAELVRVTRPGGTIALASWTPESFIGEVFRTIAEHVPPPAGVPAPMLWGFEPYLRKLFGGEIADLHTTERTFTFRFPSAEAWVAFFREWYGPTLKAFAALEGTDGSAALERDLIALAKRFDRLDDPGAVAIESTYTDAVAIRR